MGIYRKALRYGLKKQAEASQGSRLCCAAIFLQ